MLNFQKRSFLCYYYDSEKLIQILLKWVKIFMTFPSLTIARNIKAYYFVSLYFICYMCRNSVKSVYVTCTGIILHFLRCNLAGSSDWMYLKIIFLLLKKMAGREIKKEIHSEDTFERFPFKYFGKLHLSFTFLSSAVKIIFGLCWFIRHCPQQSSQWVAIWELL